MCIINKDMTNETEVRDVEKAIRNVPIRCNMQYKPVVYTEYVQFPKMNMIPLVINTIEMGSL